MVTNDIISVKKIIIFKYTPSDLEKPQLLATLVNLPENPSRKKGLHFDDVLGSNPRSLLLVDWPAGETQRLTLGDC